MKLPPSPRKHRASSADSNDESTTTTTTNHTTTAAPSSASALQNRSKKDPWTTEEDELLLRLVGEMGNRWRDIAITINSQYGYDKRIGKQCRERYLNHLKGGLKNSPWTPEEDELLRQNQKIYGNKWAAIAAAMPGRPENQVKNRWNAANFNKHGSGPAGVAAAAAASSPASSHYLSPLRSPASSSSSSGGGGGGNALKRPRLSFLDLQHQNPHHQQHAISLPTTPTFAASMQQQFQFWPAAAAGGQGQAQQAMASFAPTMLFPHYFAQHQHPYMLPPPHLLYAQPPPPPPPPPHMHYLQQQPFHHPQQQQPLFAPLVEALEKANPELVAAQLPSSSSERTPPSSSGSTMGVSPPSSCYDLFEALKSDSERLQQQHHHHVAAAAAGAARVVD